MLRDCCSDTVKVAAIIGGAIIVAVAMWLYFSPYQSCVRAQLADYARIDMERSSAAMLAATTCSPN